MARCAICDKKAVSGSNVSHSQVHTKRKFKPNLQKVNGIVLCTKCLRSIRRVAETEAA
ncbi:MAG: 50S ribosomal protein L28 [bacterium ADurb.Bin212]|nr:MAG: 50S ribosomal protein L28 [bacterium ADurb.Bin212]